MRICIVALAAGLIAGPALGSVVTDPAGDIYPAFAANPIFAGGAVPGGFDVTQFGVAAEGAAFRITASFAGAPDAIGDGIHVFGVDRGSGTPRFAPNVPNVRFDSVVVLDPSTTGGPTLTVNIIGGSSSAVPTDSLTISGNDISFLLPYSFLPTAGFAFDRYGFNLWPRFPGGGFGNIADFAPDNAVISVVPEPATWTAMLVGFGLAGATMRRKTLPISAKRII